MGIFYGFRFVNGVPLGFGGIRRERTMLIVCPTCATTYNITPAALGEAGRSVRCTKCKNTWFATPDSVLDEAALATMTAEPAPPPRAPAPRPVEPAAQSDEDLAAAWGMAEEDIGADTGAVVIENSPPLAPGDSEPSTPKFDPGEPDSIESIAARRARQKAASRKNKRTPLQVIFSAPMVIGVCLVILAGLLQSRVAMVRTFPQTASLYAAIGMPVNLRGLIFENIKSSGEFADGSQVLVVEGNVVNLTGRTLEVPRLRFALRSASGHEVYAWTALPSRPALGPGEELAFRSRLASPPPDGRDVIVRFYNRRDIGTGSP